MLAACLLVLGVLPASARAQDEFNRYFTAAVRLYKSLEYERALDQLRRASRLDLTIDQDVSVAILEGIIQADMGKREASSVAFRTALLLDPEAKLPFKVAPKMMRDFEEIRARVRKELAEGSGTNQDSSPEGHAKAPSSPQQAAVPATPDEKSPSTPMRPVAQPEQSVQKPEPQQLARREVPPSAPLVMQSQPNATQTAPQPAPAVAKAEPQGSNSGELAPVTPPQRRSPIAYTTLLERLTDYEARLRQGGSQADSSPAMAALKEIRKQTEGAVTALQRMNVSMRLDDWEREYRPPKRPAAAEDLVARPAPEPAQTRVEEPPEREEVVRVVTAHMPAVSSCIKKQRQQQPDLSGKLFMRWFIHQNGAAKRVSCVSKELCSTYLARCLTALIQSWTFPDQTIRGESVDHSFAF